MNSVLDYFNKREVPTLLLCTPSLTPVASLNSAFNVVSTLRFNDMSELSFKFPKSIDNGKTSIAAYDKIQPKMVVKLEDVGYYIISECPEISGGESPVKEVTAQSLESEMLYKRITVLSGTFKFYDAIYTADTIIGKVLKLLPNWSVGYIDPELAELYRTFDVGDNTIYNFLMSNVEEAFSCVFSFDALNRTISATLIKNLEYDSEILFGFGNTNKTITVSEYSDELATALYCYGGNDLDIHRVNPLGGNTIYNFDYYIEDTTNEWMSEDLKDALAVWKANVDYKQQTYASLSLRHNEAIEKYTEIVQSLEDKKSSLSALQITLEGMLASGDKFTPEQIAQARLDISNTQIAIRILRKTKATYRDQIDNYMASMRKITSQLKFSGKENWKTFCDELVTVINNVDYISTNWKSVYFETVDESELDFEQLSEVIPEIETLLNTTRTKAQTLLEEASARELRYWIITERDKNFVIALITDLTNSMGDVKRILYNLISNTDITINLSSDIIKLQSYTEILSYVSNLNQQQYSDLQNFIFYNTYTNSNIITTDIMTEKEIQSQAQLLYNQGVDVLERTSKPRYEFSGDFINILSLPEYSTFVERLDLGKQVSIELANGQIIHDVALLEISYDYEDPSAFSMIFSNRVKLNKSNFKFADLFIKSSSGDSGLSGITSGQSSSSGAITSSTSLAGTNILNISNALISKLGYISFGPTPPTKYGNYVGSWFGYDNGAKLSLYSSANDYLQWTGNRLLIKARNFTLDSSGNITASNADLSGKITAESGEIGGWTIGEGFLYSGAGSTMVAMDSSGAVPSFYAGSDNPEEAPFRVYPDGTLIALNAQIAGSITISGSDLTDLAGWTVTSTCMISGNMAINGVAPSISMGETSDFMAGEGLFIGESSGSYKMHIGDPNSAYIAWDGTNLTTSGSWIAGWDADSAGSALRMGSGSLTLSLSSEGGTTPVISAGSEILETSPFRVYADGSLYASSASITGNIAATSGCIGGWQIAEDKLYSGEGGGYVEINSSQTSGCPAFMAGGSTTDDASFIVNRNGSIDARNVFISGSGSIGGWKIDSQRIYTDDEDIVLNSSDATIAIGLSGSRIIIDGANGNIKSGNYSPLASGFKIEKTGDAEFNNITIRGEVGKTVLKHAEVIATAGTLGVFKSADVLSGDAGFETVIGGSFIFRTKELSKDIVLFENGDILRISNNYGDSWAEVSGYTIYELSKADSYYSCILKYTTSSASAITYKAGDTVTDYGKEGDGFLLMTADREDAPYYSVNVSTTGSPWAGSDERVRLGNISNFNEIPHLAGSSIYGIAVGDAGQYLTYDSDSGLKIKGNITITSGNIDSVLPPAMTFTYYQAIPPTISNSAVSNYWIDSEGNNAMYIWDNGTNTWKPASGIFASIDEVSKYSDDGIITTLEKAQLYPSYKTVAYPPEDNNPLSYYDSIYEVYSGSPAGQPGDTIRSNYISASSSLITTASLVLDANSGVDTTLTDIGQDRDSWSALWNNYITAKDALIGQTAEMARQLSTWDSVSGKPTSLETPEESGLYLTDDYIGYYDGGTWNVYISSSATMNLTSDTGSLEFSPDSGLSITNADIKVNDVISIGMENNSPRIAIGASGITWSNGTGIWMGENNGSYDFRAGSREAGGVTETGLLWSGASGLSILNASIDLGPISADPNLKISPGEGAPFIALGNPPPASYDDANSGIWIGGTKGNTPLSGSNILSGSYYISASADDTVGIIVDIPQYTFRVGNIGDAYVGWDGDSLNITNADINGNITFSGSPFINSSGTVSIDRMPDLSGTYSVLGHNHDSDYASIKHDHDTYYLRTSPVPPSITANSIARYSSTGSLTLTSSSAIINDAGDIVTTGCVISRNGANAQAILGADSSNGSLQLGKPSGTNSRTPSVDFFSNGTAYTDVQLKASGGAASNYGGTLTVSAASVVIGGSITYQGNYLSNFISTGSGRIQGANWSGCAVANNASATKIDMSSVFPGYPNAPVKAVLVRVVGKDSGTFGTNSNVYWGVGPSSSEWYSVIVYPPGGNFSAANTSLCTCDANGDIYYKVNGSTSGAMTCWLEVWGWII